MVMPTQTSTKMSEHEALKKITPLIIHHLTFQGLYFTHGLCALYLKVKFCIDKIVFIMFTCI